MTGEAPPGSASRRNVWVPLVLLVLTLGIYLPTIDRDSVINDCQAVAASAWRIATTGRPWMEDVTVSDLEGTTDPGSWVIENPDGHQVHARTPGPILAGVPFYWVLNNGDPVASDFRLWPGGVAAAFLTAMAGIFMFLGLRRTVGETAALLGTGALLFTTPVWSVSADALWTHSVTVLAISGGIWASTRSRWGTAGLFFALGILARPQLAVVAAVVGLYVGWKRRDWRVVARVGAASSLGMVALVAWNRVVFGFYSLSGGYGTSAKEHLVSDVEPLAYDVANFLGFFIAPDRGLLLWTPVVFLLLPPLREVWRKTPDWVRAFALAGVAYSVVQLRINSFVGGLGLYGYRHGIELVTCLTPALVFAYLATGRRMRVLVGAVLGAQFAVIAVGAVANSYWVDFDRTWYWNAFLVALSDHPVGYGLFTVAATLAGALLTLAMLRHGEPLSPQDSAEATVGRQL